MRDEIQYVKNYMQILKTRFGSRIDFYTNIDEAALGIMIPRIIIQPIVENAFIHGLQHLERNGEIHLNVRLLSDYIHIEVIDNGTGMDVSYIDSILGIDDEKEIKKRHATGIGISNVVQRLQNLFNIKDLKELIGIESEIGKGTKVVLRIPLHNNVSNEGVELNDKAVNCG